MNAAKRIVLVDYQPGLMDAIQSMLLLFECFSDDVESRGYDDVLSNIMDCMVNREMVCDLSDDGDPYVDAAKFLTRELSHTSLIDRIYDPNYDPSYLYIDEREYYTLLLTPIQETQDVH